MPNRRTCLWIVALVALFGFRLLFGLAAEFFSEDETQIYLLGLRYYATGHWPYFGPDVVWTASQVPGALQALLVGVPLRIAPLPESPFVLLNVLSTAALAWYAWYICQRIPSIPRWLVTGWLLTLPWTLEFSTHINNPSYILPAAIVFFVGFFEAVPVFSLGRIGPAWAHALMGLGLAWIVQIHMSWPLLLPYAFAAWVSRRRDGVGGLTANALAFAAGAMTAGATLFPTLVTYGVVAVAGGSLRSVHPHVVGLTTVVVLVARFFSFASLEIVRFLELTTARRVSFLAQHGWLVPFAVLVWLVGLVQPLWMLWQWFARSSRCREWRAMKSLVAGTVGLVYASYWFVIERATEAHAFYLLSPIAFMFAAYCWSFLDSPVWRRRAVAILAVNIVYHAGLAWAHAPDRSVYRDRAVIASAIRQKEPAMFAHRRAVALDADRVCLCLLPRDPDPRLELHVSESTVGRGAGGSAEWRFTLGNGSASVAFRDVICETTYRDGAGRVLQTHITPVNDIIQPGGSRAARINDGFVRPPFATATLEVVDAEALVPIR